MRQFIFSTTLSLMAFGAIQAELNDDDYASQLILINQDPNDGCPSPYSVSATFDVIGNADFNNRHCKPHFDDIHFAIAELKGSSIFYYNPECREGLIATLGYTYTNIHWKNDIYFKQDDFDTLNFGLGFFSHRGENWSWEGEVTVNADLDGFHLWDYFTFDFILAGRYAWNECIGLHAGIIALTGMKIDHVYPIVGIDWRINPNWQLNLIFPLNISLLYLLNEEWSFGVAGRAFQERHRVDQHNHLKRGLIEYYNTGVEAGVYYLSSAKDIEANLHIGEMFGGKVKVSNRRHSDSHRYRFGSSPYIGGDLAYRF